MIGGRRDVSRNVAYLPAVDHLRGAAAILMICYHGYQQLGGPGFSRASNPLQALAIEGHTAVALFLVLSGFIFTWGALQAGGEVRYGTFLRNRVLRIAPMYVLVVLLGMYTHPSGYSIGGIVQLFTLQGTPPIASADLGPFGALLWTISVEFAFYLIFPFLLRFLRTQGPWYLVALVGMMTALRALAHGVDPAGTRDLAYWTIVGRLDQLVIGMLLAWLLARRAVDWRPRWAWPAVGGAVVVALAVIDVFNRRGGWVSNASWKVVWPPIEAVTWALVIGAYVVALRGGRGRIVALVALPGVVSYSAYLLHFAIVAALRDRGVTHLVDGSGINAVAVTGLIVLPATFALATCTYLVVERPFMGLRRRYLATTPAADPSAAG
jgi:peptidoglycan/LPS O-acetylase OafA/YrhL